MPEQPLDPAKAVSCGGLTVMSERAVREGSQGFPRTVRLLKAAEFSTLFRMRPIKRSEHFVLYARLRDADAAVAASTATPPKTVAPATSAETSSPSTAAGLPGRMGLVLGKKFAPRAATRNMLRRALRETFRMRRAQFDGWDVLIRLNLRFDKQRFPGAAAPALKRVCRAEVIALLDDAARQIARRRSGS